jgi:hypothetical protein
MIRLKVHPKVERTMPDLLVRLTMFALLIGVFLYAVFINL